MPIAALSDVVTGRHATHTVRNGSRVSSVAADVLGVHQTALLEVRAGGSGLGLSRDELNRRHLEQQAVQHDVSLLKGPPAVASAVHRLCSLAQGQLIETCSLGNGMGVVISRSGLQITLDR